MPKHLQHFKHYHFALTICALLFAVSCSNPSDQTSSDTPVQVFPQDGDYSGAHILIAYAGAQRAAPTVTRTKEEAETKAIELIGKLKGDPSQFSELAKAESDGPSAERGGSLGAWQKGRMVPEFDTAIEGLEVGAFTQEPVETGFGYHIIVRNSMDIEHFGAYGFFVAHNELPNMPPEVTRGKAAADSLANSLDVNADNFKEMADANNDLGEGEIFLGAIREGDNVPESLIETLRGMEYGEVAGPVEYPFGYAFVRRVELFQRSGSHILVQYKGSMRAAPTVERSKEEAEALANSLIEQFNAGGVEFAALARENSDGPSAPNGGSLGTWFKGQMVPEFDEAIETLGAGEVTAVPVETAFGFHVIQKATEEEGGE